MVEGFSGLFLKVVFFTGAGPLSKVTVRVGDEETVGVAEAEEVESF